MPETARFLLLSTHFLYLSLFRKPNLAKLETATSATICPAAPLASHLCRPSRLESHWRPPWLSRRSASRPHRNGLPELLHIALCRLRDHQDHQWDQVKLTLSGMDGAFVSLRFCGGRQHAITIFGYLLVAKKKVWVTKRRNSETVVLALRAGTYPQ